VTIAPSSVAALAASRNQSFLASNHVWHIVEGLGFLVMSLGGIAFAEYVQKRRRARGERTDTAVASRRSATLLPLVALAGVGAAAVHFVVMPEHFEEATMYGLFFAITATTQLLYSAWLLVRPSRALLAAGAAGNLAIIGLWLVTRLIAIPLGPAAGTAEEFGGLDILATVFELTVAAGAIALIRRPLPMTRTLHPTTWSPAIWTLAPVALLAVGVTAFISPPS
jgi:hypothetical protein